MASTRFGLRSGVDWDPEESDLEEIAQTSCREAVLPRRSVAVVNRPQDTGDQEACFFGGEKATLI